MPSTVPPDRKQTNDRADEANRAGRDVRLSPPPRAIPSPRPRRPRPGGVPFWVALPLVALLAAGAVTAFVLLPRWVEERGPVVVTTEPSEDASLEQEPVASAVPLEAPDRTALETAPETAPKPTPASRDPRPASRPAPDRTPPPAAPSPPPADSPEPGEPAFRTAMSDALAALDRQDWTAAREALGQARAIRPAAPEIADARVRIETGERRARIAVLREQAEGHEAAERWDEAAAAYQAVLDLDPTVAFAREGKTRTSARAGLAAALAYHLDHPRRLSSPDVLDEAADLVAHAREIEAAGPRHREQVEALARLVDAWSQPVTARLISDRQTRVTVYRVGPLGTFGEQVLELRPGTYTVVGHREGYRDVRRDLVIRPGQPPEPLSVICDEKI